MAMKETRKPLNCQQLPSQPTWDPKTHPTPVPALMIRLWLVRIVSWWAEETSGPETCTKDVNQRVSVLRIQGQMQHSRQVIQVRKFIKVKAQSQDVRMGKFKTAAANGVWVFILLTGVNKTVEYSLPGPRISWKQSFVPLLPYLVQGFLSWHPPSWAYLVWSSFLWLFLECYQDRHLNFPVADHDFLFAGLQVPVRI